LKKGFKGIWAGNQETLGGFWRVWCRIQGKGRREGKTITQNKNSRIRKR
jgi:hypothetical protein